MKRSELIPVKISLTNKINYFAGLALAFSLPFYRKIIPFLIFIWALSWIIEGGMYRKIFNLKSSLCLLLLILLYVVHFIGMTYTSNVEAGLFDLEVKFSLLLFPFLAAGVNRLYRINFNKILYAFVLGCITASLICLGRALFLYVSTGENYFSYIRFSYFHHPTYFAAYISFSLVIVVYFLLFGKLKRRLKTIGTLIVLFFLVVLFLLSSKAGIICGYLSLIGLSITYLLTTRKYYFSLLLVVLLLGGLYVSISVNDRFASIPAAALHENENKTTTESSAVRVLIWSSSMDIIKEHFLTGVGTGDVKDELIANYRKNNLSGAAENKLNAHNQYIETLVGNGIFALILLLGILLVPVIASIRMKNYILLFFIIIFAINFLFESMLNIQAGVVFFAFFYSLLVTNNNKSLI